MCTCMQDIFKDYGFDWQAYLDVHVVHLTWSFFKQSVLKQILTEGKQHWTELMSLQQVSPRSCLLYGNTYAADVIIQFLLNSLL